jgi:AcrR family transcriptional regulator
VKTHRAEGTERDRIIESFIAVVAEAGYGGTPLDAVLARAGIDAETFHRHFDDEDACFRAAWEYVSARYMPTAQAAYEGASGWRWQMRALAHAILRYLTEHPDHARILFIEGAAPEPSRTPIDPNVEVFIDLIDRGRLEMDDPDALTRATAEGLAGAADERIVLCLQRGADDELPRLLPQLMYMIVRPYLGEEVAIEELHGGVDDDA